MDSPKPEWECFCCPASFDMWRVRKVGERGYEQGFLVVDQKSAEALRDYLSRPTPSEATVERARGKVKSLINAHVKECLRLSGTTSLGVLHPGPTADAIIAAIKALGEE